MISPMRGTLSGECVGVFKQERETGDGSPGDFPTLFFIDNIILNYFIEMCNTTLEK